MDRAVPGILGLAAFVALVILAFNVPWAHHHQDFGFGSADQTVSTWQYRAEGSAGSFSGGDTKPWTDGDWDKDQQAAVDQFRIAGPLVVGGAALLLVGGIVAFVKRGPVSGVVSTVGAVVAIVGTVLFCIATQDLLDGDQSWLVGFYLAITGCVLGLASGVTGLIGSRTI